MKVGMTTTYYTQPDGRRIAFPDCGETSLRNLLNIILFNSETRIFDANVLKNLIGASPTPQQQLLIKYYEKDYRTQEKMVENESHARWAQVVSDLPGVRYETNPICEISPGITNMLKVISNVLPGTGTFESLEQKLNTHGIEITFKPHNPTRDIDTTINITLTKEAVNYNFTWDFLSRHFELNFPYSNKQMDHAARFLNGLRDSTLNLALLRACFNEPLQSLIDRLQRNNIIVDIESALQQAIFCLPFSAMSQQQKQEFILYVVNKNASKITPQSLSLLYDAAAKALQAVVNDLDGTILPRVELVDGGTKNYLINQILTKDTTSQLFWEKFSPVIEQEIGNQNSRLIN